MAFQPRGGPPIARSLSIGTEGSINGGGTTAEAVKYVMPAASTWVDIGATGNPVRVYFNVEDFMSGLNFLPVAAGANFSAPMEARFLWFRATGGVSVVNLFAIVKG